MVGQIDNWLPLDLQDETAGNGAVASADFFDVKKVREKKWTALVHTLHIPKPVITDDVRVQSATHWAASVHTIHMPKPVITYH